MASSEESKIAEVVADHYNKTVEDDGLETRSQSRIYHMRNFNNWIKSTLIREFTKRVNDSKFDPEINVLDIGCGKGGDLVKWHKGDITHLVCADIAEAAVERCKERYNENVVARNRNGSVYSAEFITADCTRKRLRDFYQKKDIMFDIVSVQFSFHYCFESLPQAEIMLQNISENLNTGGYFIATTVDSFELMKRLQKVSGLSFGNEVYSVSFEQKENLPLFGAKYHFNLEGVVDCPEFLVYVPLLVKLAKKYNLRLLYRKKLEDYFVENCNSGEAKSLLTRMTALETYPPVEGKQLCGEETRDYKTVKEGYKKLISESHAAQNRSSDQLRVGTLSQSEWEVISIYVILAFVKEDGPLNP